MMKMYTPTFSISIPLEGVSGRFSDPFYPWIEYEYEFDIGWDDGIVVGEDRKLTFRMHNVRDDNSGISGKLEVDISIDGGERSPDQKHVVHYCIEGGCSYEISYHDHEGMLYNVVEFDVKHVGAPAIWDYKCAIRHVMR